MPAAVHQVIRWSLPRTAAKVAMLNALATVAAVCGGALPTCLDVCRVRGFIRSKAEFTAHTAVLDAASDVLSTTWLNASSPARTAVGAASLGVTARTASCTARTRI